MNRPTKSNMEAYLTHLNQHPGTSSSDKIEQEYLRSIFKVLPREQGLKMTLKQAKARTNVRP